MAAELILARHGSIGVSYEGCYVGARDVLLDNHGRDQAAALGKALAGRKVDCAFSSPQRRALETAEIAGNMIGLEFTVDPDLREVDFGEWEGKTFQEIEKSDPELVEKWACFDSDFAFPGGERIQDYFDRVKRAAGRLAGNPAETVLAVTHGGVIRSMICMLLGLELRNYITFEVANASITTIKLFDGKGVLAELNNCSHLERL